MATEMPVIHFKIFFMSQKKDDLLQLVGGTQKMAIYRKKNGTYGFRKKGGVSKERIETDPNYAVFRLNLQDFGKAGKAGGLIKTAFKPLIPKEANSELFPRLTKLCKAVIKSDLEHERGSRSMKFGDMNLLTGFDFNPAGALGTTFIVPFTHSLDRVAGLANIDLPEFIAANMIVPPPNATHFRMKIAAVAINFDEGKYVLATGISGDLALNDALTAPLTISAQLPANNTDPVLIALGIEFLLQEGNFQYPVNNSRFNGLQLIGVDNPA